MEWEEARARLEGLAQSKPPVIDVSGGKFYADIRAVLQRVAELEKQLEDMVGMAPCPKCGQGISATCLGCEIKRLEGLIVEWWDAPPNLASEHAAGLALGAEARRIREREGRNG